MTREKQTYCGNEYPAGMGVAYDDPAVSMSELYAKEIERFRQLSKAISDYKSADGPAFKEAANTQILKLQAQFWMEHEYCDGEPIPEWVHDNH